MHANSQPRILGARIQLGQKMYISLEKLPQGDYSTGLDCFLSIALLGRANEFEVLDAPKKRRNPATQN